MTTTLEAVPLWMTPAGEAGHIITISGEGGRRHDYIVQLGVCANTNFVSDNFASNKYKHAKILRAEPWRSLHVSDDAQGS